MLHLPDGTRREIQVQPGQTFEGTAISVRAAGALTTIQKFIRDLDPQSILVDVLADEAPTCVLFDLGHGPWQVPWEMALENLPSERARRAFVPARTVGGPLEAGPSRRVDKLNVLIMTGDPGELDNRIYPEREAEGIVAAWKALDSYTRERIAEPQVIKFDPGTLGAELATRRPHVLWYCGHGRATPEPGLLFKIGHWVPVDIFAAEIPTVDSPIACIFWACDLGATNRLDLAPAPQVHSAIAARGVRVTLAMQSPINDRVARGMAIEFFGKLATGLSFERAAACARRFGQTIPQRYPDWASPAVWISHAPLEALEWGTPPKDPLLARLLARISVRLAQKVPDTANIGDEAKMQADSWVMARRVIVQADTSSEAVYLALNSIAGAVAENTTFVPLFIIFRGNAIYEALSEWAKTILAWTGHEEMSTPLGEAIKVAKIDPVAGFERLVVLDDVMLVLIDPPMAQTSEILDLVEHRSPAAPTVLVSPGGFGGDQFQGWSRDTLLGGPADRAVLELLMHEVPEPLVALAVLDLPLPESELAAVGFNRARFPLAASYLFETSMGPVLAAHARSAILSMASAAQVRRAHEACLELLGTEGIGHERLGLERLRHLVGLRETGKALQAAGILIEVFSQDERLLSVIDVFNRLSPLAANRRDLETHHLLMVATAYVRLGNTKRTGHLLKQFEPSDLVQKAFWHALRSEVAKAEGRPGWRETAVKEIELAIGLCEKASRDPDPELALAAERDLPDWELNRARLLQYLAYDPKRAEAVYTALINRWGGQPEHRLLVATAARNLAECISSQAPGDPVALQRAEAELERAKNALHGFVDDPLHAELLYERVKLAELRSDNPEVIRALLKECISESRRTGYGMLEAIARSRLYWATEPIDLDAWNRFARTLGLYRWHGWALRTLANGRIRAARALAKRGDVAQALSQLRHNQLDLAAKRAFDRGSDRDRTALTISGLLTLCTEDAERSIYRHKLDDHSWVGEWLAERGLTSIEQAWESAR